MPVSKDDHSCAVCRKRHEVEASEAGGGIVKIPGRLECRALPPVQDVGRHAAFPTVTSAHYCHVYFEVDPDAIAARRSAAASVASLDAKVAATQAAAAPPPPAQPELALEAEPEAPRARRARPKAAK
jgi:hypothetical protein